MRKHSEAISKLSTQPTSPTINVRGRTRRRDYSMKLISYVAAMALLTIFAAPQVKAQSLKVGTFHKPSIVVAYYRSQLWADSLKPKLAELQEAKKASDAKKVKELESWGEAHQETAHQQLTGEAPITNILEALQPAWPEIARKAQVTMIVADVQFTDNAVQTVDVTGLLLDWLKADAPTRKIVLELQSHKGPLPPLH
ncbi:MAG TPA: hypothetical protein VEU96_17060 [Bryobacteraceae bacterium]|nr:hypothetical protein [Bryobacteraceae bacterium]